MPTVARLFSADSSASTARLRIAEVKRGTLTRDVSVQGKVVAAVSPTLYARSAGTVDLDIHAGDKVNKGDVLAVVDSPELTNKLEAGTGDARQPDARRRARRHRSPQAAARRRRRRSTRRASTARPPRAKSSARRKAFTAGALPELDVLRAKDALAKADLTVTNAEQDGELERDSLAFELKTKRLALDRQKLLVDDVARQVDELKVRSPVDGQVGQLIVQQRANVAANAPLLTVIDLSALEIEVQIPEVFAHDLSIGMPAEVQRRRAASTPAKSARCRPKSSTARSRRACASATTSRSACARTSSSPRAS